MDLQHLRYVTAIERAGSITRAAKELYMSQPNLSRAVKEVEQETGFAVFRRTPHGVAPTERGMPFLDYARRILSQMDEMESLYKAPAESAVSLDVALPPAVEFAAGLGDFLAKLPAHAPLCVHCRESTALEAIAGVAGGISEFAVVRYNKMYRDYFDNALENAGLLGETLWEFNMCLTLGANHPLIPCAEVPYHLLDGYTEVVYGDLNLPALSFTKISYGAKMKQDRRQIHVYDCGTLYHLLHTVPGTYLWGAPLPFGALAQYGLAQKQCPIADGLCCDVLIRRKKQPLSKLGKGLLGAIKRTCPVSAVYSSPV